MTVAPRSPWPWLIGGLALSILGVVSTYLIPGSRMVGLTPLAFVQCVAVFGGMLAMSFSLSFMENTRVEQDAEIRSVVRYLMVLGAAYALLIWLGVPFAFFLSIFAAVKLSEPFRRFFAWLGRA